MSLPLMDDLLTSPFVIPTETTTTTTTTVTDGEPATTGSADPFDNPFFKSHGAIGADIVTNTFDIPEVK